MSVAPVPHLTAVASDAICGLYRLTIPLRALVRSGRATGNVVIGWSEPLRVETGAPILLQRQLALADEMIVVAKRSGCRLVHDLDDLLWSIPDDNPNVGAFTSEMLARMEHQLGVADAITVSTQPLADALRARGFAAQVLPNVLDPVDWVVQPRRAPRAKPRVGWYGQRAVHVADLAVIESVVRELIDDAQFVFFGDMPAALADLAPRLLRVPTVPLRLFPVTLAALDLDLMLAPLADNPFNAAKSNLRLLQAGMLGYPVVASDVEPHRSLPVALVPNTPAAWVAAVRERIADRAALRRAGEVLRSAVMADYLVDDWAERFLAVWTGRVPVAAHA